jgi:hypothetical protein
MDEGEACSNVAAMGGLEERHSLNECGVAQIEKGTEVPAPSTLTPPFATESVSGVSEVEIALCKHRSLAFRRRAFYWSV